jgi:hypothetical protein
MQDCSMDKPAGQQEPASLSCSLYLAVHVEHVHWSWLYWTRMRASVGVRQWRAQVTHSPSRRSRDAALAFASAFGLGAFHGPKGATSLSPPRPPHDHHLLTPNLHRWHLHVEAAISNFLFIGLLVDAPTPCSHCGAFAPLAARKHDPKINAPCYHDASGVILTGTLARLPSFPSPL